MLHEVVNGVFPVGHWVGIKPKAWSRFIQVAAYFSVYFSLPSRISRNTSHIWVVTCHQYFCTPFSDVIWRAAKQMVASRKVRLFSQATILTAYLISSLHWQVHASVHAHLSKCCFLPAHAVSSMQAIWSCHNVVKEPNVHTLLAVTCTWST